MTTRARVPAARTWLAALCVSVLILSSACGTDPGPMGVRVDRLGVVKTSAGRSPEGLVAAEFTPDSGPGAGFRRLKHGDIVGDTEPDTVIEIGAGRGVEVFDGASGRRRVVRTAEYLTDYGILPGRGAAGALVLYTYPNDKRGGTFSIRSMATGRTVTEWREFPPTPRFAIGEWRGETALLYFRGGHLVVRDPDGTLLLDRAVNGAEAFQGIRVQSLPDGLTVVVTSGDGYTAYHMVCVFDSAGEMVFQEVAPEHAFRIEVASDHTFDVLARTTRWRYAFDAAGSAAHQR